MIPKQEFELKASYKLNYDAPKLSSYEQVKEEQKFKSKQVASASDASTADDSKLPSIKGQKENSKVVITGDDVLIEYVTRVIKKLETISEMQIGQAQCDCIINFITHYVWHSEDLSSGSLCERLNNRLNEMVLRRKKLLKSLCKKEAVTSNSSTKDIISAVSSMIEERERQKSSLLENFKIGYLEEMLKSTTKSIARDVVSTLFSTDNSGVLLILENKLKGSTAQDKEEQKYPVEFSNDTMQNKSDAMKSKATGSSVKFPSTVQSKLVKPLGKLTSSGKSTAENRSNSSKPNSKFDYQNRSDRITRGTKSGSVVRSQRSFNFKAIGKN